MPACEMCGKEAPLRLATVEGTRMTLCPNCLKFGVEVAGQPTAVKGRGGILSGVEDRVARVKSRDIFQEADTEIVADFGKRIRDARQRKGLTQEELARKLNERQSVLSRVEAGTQRPNEDLARRLQRELGISLFEKVEPSDAAGGQPKSAGSFTLGDMIRREPGKK